jgi:hypothetical protein
MKASVCIRTIKDILENDYLAAMVGQSDSPEAILSAIEAAIRQYHEELFLESGDSQ